MQSQHATLMFLQCKEDVFMQVFSAKQAFFLSKICSDANKLTRFVIFSQCVTLEEGKKCLFSHSLFPSHANEVCV